MPAEGRQKRPLLCVFRFQQGRTGILIPFYPRKGGFCSTHSILKGLPEGGNGHPCSQSDQWRWSWQPVQWQMLWPDGSLIHFTHEETEAHSLSRFTRQLFIEYCALDTDLNSQFNKRSGNGQIDNCSKEKAGFFLFYQSTQYTEGHADRLYIKGS